MKRLLFILLVVAVAGFAQERQETVRKLIKLQHVQAREVRNLLGWIQLFPSDNLETILVQGTPEDVAKAEEVIRAVDLPELDSISDGTVELDAYFLSAGAEPSGNAIPPILDPVTAELKKRFPYAHYGLLDSALVQVMIGTPAGIEGQFTGVGDLATSYSLGVQPTLVSGEKGARTIRLNRVEAHWKIPYQTQLTDPQSGKTTTQTFNRDLRIGTEVSVPEGKLVVVGKAGSPTNTQAIFLVLRARLVE